jgi:predicted nuclease of predicted toxin-antitoxin system
MWLLDVNLPTGLLAVLRDYGIICDSTANRGWRDLTNGLLAEAAFSAGFRVILTRDRLFGDSANRVLQDLQDLAVVVVTLRQVRAVAYLAEFRARWEQRSIEPVSGRVVEWP